MDATADALAFPRLVEPPAEPSYGLVAGDILPATAHPNYSEPWSMDSSVDAFVALGLDAGVRFDNLILGGPREPEDSWRASDLGYCRRKSFYGRLQAVDPERAPKADHTTEQRGKFLFGHMIEAVVVAAIQADPRVRWVDAQSDLSYDGRLVGHSDGLVRRLDLPDEPLAVVEVKSMNSMAFRYAKELPKPYHRYQIISYGMAYRQSGHDVDVGHVLYVSKDDWKRSEHRVRFTDKAVAEVELELDALDELWEADTLPRRLPGTVVKRGKNKGQRRRNWKCQPAYCEFVKPCYAEDE